MNDDTTPSTPPTKFFCGVCQVWFHDSYPEYDDETECPGCDGPAYSAEKLSWLGHTDLDLDEDFQKNLF